MVYSAPELLLIGAAQSLVQGGMTTPDSCVRSDTVGQSDLVELW